MFKQIFLIFFVLISFILPALAEPFSDVPQNHWSYDAVNTLQEKGLVEGYPDGLFKGDRPMTRYEMAMVVARLLARLQEVEAKIPPPVDLSPYATKKDLEVVNALIKEYKNELDALGVRVSSVEDSLGKLTGRVQELERIKISGNFETVAVGEGIYPQSGNTAGPGNVAAGKNTVTPHYDRYLNPLGNAFVLAQGFALVSRLDMTITAKISDKVKAGGNLVAYSAFGDKYISECWGPMIPYNSLGVNPVWKQSFQTGMGTLWIDSDIENWDATVRYGEFNLNKVSKNLFYGQRSTIGLGGRDVLPLNGLDITGKLYNTVDFEMFTARNSNVYRRINDYTIYGLGTPYNEGSGAMRLLTEGTMDTGLYDNYMYGFWGGYDYEKIFHIEGAYVRIYDDFASNPLAPTQANFQEPREALYYGFKGHYNLKENIKIYGEFGGTRYNSNMRDPSTQTGKGYLFNIGGEAKIDNFLFYGEFDYTSPNYDPFAYHQTWERSYTDGHHAGWDWKYGARWGNSVRFGKFRPNRLGFDGGLTYKLDKGDLYADVTYLKQTKATLNTGDENTFNIDPATGLARINLYGNQDPVFRYASDSKGSEFFIEVGGRYAIAEKIHVWGMYDYMKFQRDYAAGTTGRTSNNVTDFSYHFAYGGVTYDVTDKFSLQGNIQYYKLKGVADSGSNVDESQVIPGFGAQYKFNDSTSWIIDYKFYSFADNTKAADNNWDYHSNKILTRLEVKF